jgi:hypothetical protein
MKPPIIIVGAHRSGTSATAHALLDMGLFLGAHRMPRHDEAFFFFRIQNDYLKASAQPGHSRNRFSIISRLPKATRIAAHTWSNT